MKTRQWGIRTYIALLLLAFALPAMAGRDAGAARAARPEGGEVKSIPWSELGAQAGKKYSGEALSVSTTESGARLRTDFQRLRGEVGEQGLVLESTASEKNRERFSLSATALKREGVKPLELPRTGRVETTRNLARWVRQGVTEEYSVSVDGVRQDFVITERPEGNGPLHLELALSGGRAEAADYGARITLDGSGRKLAYSRLKAWDATGRELPARMTASTADRLTVAVEDRGTVLPLRIDPTFSDDNWVSMGSANGVTGNGGYINALAMDATGNLYAGGSFVFAGGFQVNNIAKWNGSYWSPLGSGMDGFVYALAVDSSGNVYAGGPFTTAGGVSAVGIAKWNGNAWISLGDVEYFYGDKIRALALDAAGNLFAAGRFTAIGGVSANSIAKWDGHAWSALGSGLVGGYITALAIDSAGNLYAGCDFYFPLNGQTEGNAGVAKWDGNYWSSLGFNSTGVAALAIDRFHNLYVAGSFTTAGDVSANRIAKWDGRAWSALGSGLDGAAASLVLDGDDNLYVGGLFTSAGGVNASKIAKWNGSTWFPLDSGVNDQINALAVNGAGKLFAGGFFTTAGNVAANSAASWDGQAWSPLGSGANDSVLALTVDNGNNLYVGGSFTTIGGIGANRIARWDGASWEPLGSGMNGGVLALTADGAGNLYAGGSFTTAGDVDAGGIAKWDGKSWSNPGTNKDEGGNVPEYRINALAVDGAGNLYAGGAFNQLGGVGANCVAKWDGSQWSPLGGGMESPNNVDRCVSSLVFDKSGTLYAGGMFATADGVSVNGIARWDGSQWSSLGSGTNGNVYAIDFDGSGNLYAGGTFTRAGDVSANHIAKWDGASWLPLGSGVNDTVNALAIDGLNNVYAGGTFTGAGATGVNRIAKWNGSSWSNLGSGVDAVIIYPSVNALAIDSIGNLYLAGFFTIAGTKGSNFLAKAVIRDESPARFTVTAPSNATTGTAFTFTVRALDQYNSTATVYNGTVHFSSTDGSAVLPADAKLTNGTGTFTATLNTAGTRTITATDTTASSITGTSASITVTAPPVLSISFAGNGSGTVTSTSPDARIYCLKGSSANCSATFPAGTPVTLAATADWKSLFATWSGGVTGTTNPATLTMTAARAVTATFTPIYKAKLLPAATLFASIQDAYDAVTSGSITIRAQTYSFQEALLFGHLTDVVLTGGLDSSYQTTTGRSSVKGLTVEQGSVTVDGITIY